MLALMGNLLASNKMHQTGSPIAGRLLLQRACACGSHTGQASCDTCSNKQGTLRRSALSSRVKPEVPSIVHDVLRSEGRPLDLQTRAFMEPRFGHDFSQVRVHTDSQAAESARMVNALAYTAGRDVVFA